MKRLALTVLFGGVVLVAGGSSGLGTAWLIGGAALAGGFGWYLGGTPPGPSGPEAHIGNGPVDGPVGGSDSGGDGGGGGQ
jgi:hypothetical protein